MVILSVRHNLPSSETILTLSMKKIFAAQSAPPIILCIGSDKVTGDCLGPLTGSLLISRYNVGTFVYGTLDAPVTASNLTDTVAFIKERHAGQKILAIDAALGAKADIGAVRLLAGGIKPGTGVGKFFGLVGDFCLAAVVGKYSPSSLDAAYVPLGMVQRLSEFLARCITASLTAPAPKSWKGYCDTLSYA